MKPVEDSMGEAILEDNAQPVSSTEVTRDLEFTLSKTFQVTNYDDPVDVVDRSAANVVSQIDSFNPQGLTPVENVDVYYTTISLDITQIHVIEDRDFGAGEVYLKVSLNRYYEYTFDNDGNFYIANDGDYVSTDISLLQGLYSIDGFFSIEIFGWESDFDDDDFMGGELFYIDQRLLQDRSYTGWYSLDYYPPIGGNNPIQLEVYLDLQLSSTAVYSYPDDWEFPAGDASYLISTTYLPKIFYDTVDCGDIPGINCIYNRVYYGYDTSIGQNAYVICYMFYYDYETDNFGVNFGHYYDFEPLFLFVTDIGSTPYRVVYRDVGPYTLPPKVIIQDYYSTTGSGTLNTSVSAPLAPLLGNESMVQFEIRDDYWSTPEYRHETEHGLTPFMEVPVFSVTNSYHQMELGIVFWNADALVDFSYLQPLDDQVIEWGFCLLDEAFDSPINVYEGVNLWNGADYEVPENMSLTFDMLHSPFEFPYMVDCYEEVVHYTEAAQEYIRNGFYYDIDLQLDFIVPATVTLTIPTSVTAGESYDIGIDIALDANAVRVRFLYDIYLGFSYHWWFIGIDENATYAGEFEFEIPLQDIADILDFLEIGSSSIEGMSFRDWVTLSHFDTSTDLLGTMLEATVEFHLLRILEDTLGQNPQLKWLFKALGFFIDDVDLIASPSISGYVTGEIVAGNSAIDLDTSSLVFEEGNTHATVGMTVPGGPTETSVSLQNMQYHMEFLTEWGLELDLTDTVNYFVDDKRFHLGTFPEIMWSSDEHSVDASVTTGFDNPVIMAVVNDVPIDTTGTDTSTTETETSTTGPGGATPPSLGDIDPMLLLMGVVAAGGITLVAVLALVIKKRGS
jgi:hypothetical protein